MTLPVPDSKSLYFVPLGGSGEIGMNLNLYGHAGKWLMVDLGITFADDTIPGVEVILPDPAAIEACQKDLAGIVITHAHEDHIGAVGYLWPRLKCPVYTTPFAAEVLRGKLEEKEFGRKVPIRVVPVGGRFSVGPFDLEMIGLTHSIPEPTALAIRTPAGTVLHTGDWKLDDTPLVGKVTDVDTLKKVGQEGVLAMVCDSTNALVPGKSGSEDDVRRELLRLFPTLKNRIVVTCFATNVARVTSIFEAAHRSGRQVALVGRSLWRLHEAARATGYIHDLPPPLEPADAAFLPRDRVVLVCTGSQGEPRAALTRIAFDDHPEIVLEEGDTVIYSSREIPGNEKAIGRVQNALSQLDVNIITSRDAAIHVSGHPARDELVQMYQWIRPQTAIPVHGEYRHQAEHARLAAECQVPHTIVPQNGSVVRLAPGKPEIVDTVPTGRLCLDGTRIVPLDWHSVRNRQRMMHSGAVVVSLVMNRKGKLMADPQVSAMGLDGAEPEHDVMVRAARAATQALDKLPSIIREDDDTTVQEAVRVAVRRVFTDFQGKKPLTQVQIIRV
ncbi:MAG: ribonuclease J [Pseudomonadota bacterium]|nr:ribonuclease J [Pseudomonadota bacterium]